MRLKAGMVANVTFVAARHHDVLVVSRGAVLSTDSGSAVYVVDKGGKAKLRQVTVALETQTEAEISGAGIAAGTVVITQRPDALGDGSPVKVVTTN
jgi:multidrug efflux pump subunit AcrA (membrane-fusion protein)